MTPAARRCHERLEAMGFVRDVDRSNRERSVWSHPNDPGQQIRVYVGIKEDAATLKLRRAEQIAGLSTSGDGADTIKDRARIRRQQDARKRVAAKLAHDKALAPYQEAADARAAEKARRIRADEKHRLMSAVEDAREQLSRVNQRGQDPRKALVQLQIARDRLHAFTSGGCR